MDIVDVVDAAEGFLPELKFDGGLSGAKRVSVSLIAWAW